ncbi:hypothetical protein [Lysobacter antibioticus]|uniref:hypothetical protein n=1 Tax=Lysobacter antibioticus TaxID=84531 RepID=UPI0011401176|nr:hypothetical protein [Lysobacter antibioticus]
MKNASRKQPQRAVRATTLRDSLEAKLLKVCADIGWICGWRKDRLAPAPPARRSSRKRVMLGRALAAEERVQEDEAFLPIKAALVSSGRAAHIQTGTAPEASGLADFTVDLQGGLARLRRMEIGASEVAGALDLIGARPQDREL